MNDYKKPRTSHDIVRFYASVVVVIALFALTTVAVRAAYGMYQTFNTAAIEANSVGTELAALDAQYVQVQTTLAALGTERGMEKAVRERFGVVRPGEGEIRIVRDQGSIETDTAVQDKNIITQFLQSLFVW